MKKIFLFAFCFISLSASAQIPADTGALRQKINTDIVTNGNKSITATQLNNILIGIVNLMKAYGVDSGYRVADTLFLTRRGGFTTIKITLNSGGAPTETDPTVSAAAKSISPSDLSYWNAKQPALVTGTGVYMTANLIQARNDSAIWNAFRLNGNPVADSIPTVNQVLTWNGTNWTPRNATSSSLYDSLIMKSTYRARQDSIALAAPPGNDQEVIFNDNGVKGSSPNFVFNKAFRAACLGCDVVSGDASLDGGGALHGVFYLRSQNGPIEVSGDTATVKATVGTNSMVRVITNNSERLKIDNNGGIYWPGLAQVTNDTAANKIKVYNTSTGKDGYMNWIGGGSTNPGGSNQQFQFNNSSAFGGARRVTYNTSTQQTTFDSALVRMNINQSNVTGLSYYLPNVSGVFSGVISQIFPSFYSDTNYVTYSRVIGGSDNGDGTHDNVVKDGWNIDGRDNPNKMGYWRSWESNYLSTHIGENHLMSFYYPGYTELRGLSNYFDPHHAVGYGSSNRATLALATSSWDFRGTSWTYSNILDKAGAGLNIDTSGNGTMSIFNDSLQTLIGSGFGNGSFQINPAQKPSIGATLNMGAWDYVNVAGILFDKATGNMSTGGILGAGVVSGNTLNFNSSSSITVDNTYPFIRNPGQINGIFGIQAGQSLNPGLAAFNDLFGYQAGQSITSGSRNLIYGTQAGRNISTGNGNNIIGVGAAQGANFDKSVIIGDSAAINAPGIITYLGLSDFSNLLWVENKPDSLPLIYGRFDTRNVGINSTNTSATLNVGGSVYFEQADSIATGAATNVMTWDKTDNKIKIIAIPGGGGGGAVITDATLTGDGTSGNHLKVDSNIIASKGRLMEVADSLGALIGGGGPTPTFEQTVTAGNTFSSNISIDGVNNTKNFIIQGTDSLRFIQNSYTENEGDFNMTGQTSALNFKETSSTTSPRAYIKFDNFNGYMDLQTNYGYHMRFLNDVNEMARFSFGTRAFLINTTSPLGTEKLNINGSVVITDGTEGAGKVFTSDANGLGSWQTLSVGGNTNSNVGSAFRLAKPGTNDIKTVSGGPWFVLDSTTTNQIRGSVDTSAVVARVRQIIFDSLAALRASMDYVRTKDIITHDATPINVDTILISPGEIVTVDVLMQAVRTDGHVSMRAHKIRDFFMDDASTITNYSLNATVPEDYKPAASGLSTASFTITSSGSYIFIQATGESSTSIKWKPTYTVTRHSVPL